MITFRISADVTEDHQVVLILPPEVPTGKTDLVVTVESSISKQARTSGVPASVIPGIAAGNGPPPDDDTIEQWMHERSLEKYG